MDAAGALDYDVVWKTFSLEQINLEPDADADELWATPERRRGLLPVAAAKWAEERGPDELEAVQRAFFEARHVESMKIGRPEVAAEVLDRAGLDGEKVVNELIEDRRWLDAARADHEEAEELGIFGVPTLAFHGCQPAFLRILEITEGDRAVEIWQRLVTIAHDPVFHEFKRPTGLRR